VREDTYAFVIRIWHEAVDKGGRVIAWRGSIQHVGTGERLHFDDIDEMSDFIRKKSYLDDEPAASWWQSLLGWKRL
jgi:hypothetical protein